MFVVAVIVFIHGELFVQHVMEVSSLPPTK